MNDKRGRPAGKSIPLHQKRIRTPATSKQRAAELAKIKDFLTQRNKCTALEDIQMYDEIITNIAKEFDIDLQSSQN